MDVDWYLFTCESCLTHRVGDLAGRLAVCIFFLSSVKHLLAYWLYIAVWGTGNSYKVLVEKHNEKRETGG